MFLEMNRKGILFHKRFTLITWDIVLNNLSECAALPLVAKHKARATSFSFSHPKKERRKTRKCSKNVQFLIGLFFSSSSFVSCYLFRFYQQQKAVVRHFIENRVNKTKKIQLNWNQLAMSPQQNDQNDRTTEELIENCLTSLQRSDVKLSVHLYKIHLHPQLNFLVRLSHSHKWP